MWRPRSRRLFLLGIVFLTLSASSEPSSLSEKTPSSLKPPHLEKTKKVSSMIETESEVAEALSAEENIEAEEVEENRGSFFAPKIHTLEEEEREKKIDRLQRAREASANPAEQRSAIEHGVDTAAFETFNHKHPSVLGSIESGIESGIHTLGDRLKYSFSHISSSSSAASHESKHHQGLAPSSSSPPTAELANELLKASGVKSKTSMDKVNDVLENLHLKDKSDAKAAAERIASTFPPFPESASHEEIARIVAAAASKKDSDGPQQQQQQPQPPSTTWHSVLQSIGLHSTPSEIESAIHSYETALHDMKVALGTEDRFLSEKINAAFSDSLSAIKQSASTANAWLSKVGKGTEKETTTTTTTTTPPPIVPAPHSSILHSARETWDTVSSRTVSALFRARDAASEAVNALVSKVTSGAGTTLTPEKKSLVSRAKNNLDAATHRILVTLGYDQPTFIEKMKAFSPSGARLSTSSSSVLESGKTAAADVMHKMSSATDSALKSLGLRPRSQSPYERAVNAYYLSLQHIKSSLGSLVGGSGGEEKTPIVDTFSVFVEDQRNKMNEILQSILESSPTAAVWTQTITYELPATVHESSQAVRQRAHDLMDIARMDTDKALKALHFRDKSTSEILRDNVTAAWHDLKLALGAEKPTMIESIEYSVGKKRGLSGLVDRLLKLTGLRDKSPMEKSRDAWLSAAHKFAVSMGNEDPYITERILQALRDAREEVNEITQFLLDHTISSSSASASSAVASTGKSKMSHFNAELKDKYDELSAATLSSLLRVRDEAGRLLHLSKKEKGEGRTSPLHHAYEALESSMHQLGVDLGFAEPSFFQNVESIWHRAKVRIGMEEPTLLEKIRSRVSAAEHHAHDLLTGGEEDAGKGTSHTERGRRVWTRVFSGRGA